MFGGLQDIDFGALDRANYAPMTPTLQQDAAEAIRIAKVGTIAVVALQAVAALSAFGLFVLAAKTYGNNQKRSRRSR